MSNKLQNCGRISFPRRFDHPESLLSFRFTQADLHIASENSRQQGRNPNTFLGTSSTHKIPEIMGRKGISFHTTVSKNPVPAL